MKCDIDIRKELHAKVVLSDSAAIFQQIGEHMAQECNVSYDRVFASVVVIVVVSLGAHRLDIVTLLHIPFPCHRAVVCTRSLFQRIRVGSNQSCICHAENRGSCVRILLTVTRDAVSIILVVFCPLRVGRSVCIRCTQQVLFSLVV